MRLRVQESQKRFLRRLWLSLALFYASLFLAYLHQIDQTPRDVLGFAPGEGPSVAEVVARNKQVLHVSAPAQTPLLPDLLAHPPSDLGLVGVKGEGTLRLKFSTRFSNVGEGPLEVRARAGSENARGESEALVQVLYSQDASSPLAHQPVVGQYALEQKHGHLHLENFARYELWSVDAQGELRDVLVSNPKVGFCLLDAERQHPELAASEEAVYWGCRSEVQGLSVGWGDLYVALLAVQDLNVSALPDGRYALVNIINHQKTLIEGDYRNNRAATYLRLEDGAVRAE